jgi:hypothetical protein
MNSNNHPGAYGYQPRAATPSPFYPPKPVVQEDTLAAGMVDIERKTFAVALKDNPRGRFLRITEKNGTRHATIIIPSTGLKEFQQVLAEMIQADADLPQKNPPQDLV